jgi:phage terminase large subunit-like protein
MTVFLACFQNYRKYLGPGERATIMIIAADRRQARVIFRYVPGLLKSVSDLAKMIQSADRETINLDNRVTIEMHTAPIATVRGYSIAAALCDEIAFWRTDASARIPTLTSCGR